MNTENNERRKHNRYFESFKEPAVESRHRLKSKIETASSATLRAIPKEPGKILEPD